MRRALTISLRSKTRSSSCTLTRSASFISGSCTVIRRALPSHFGLHCARPPKPSLWARCGDKETIEIALEAAETGHLVLSTLHTIDAAKTVERIVGVFPLAEQ